MSSTLGPWKTEYTEGPHSERSFSTGGLLPASESAALLLLFSRSAISGHLPGVAVQ